ncbi:tungstate transport system permease protein [Anaerosolibacter carboniphilus]|uniref:Tungstate transport system permease protein n=1 Tax=Anaerosolibacter carboniphilus TaxID=1417629 RepID=A0A841KS26_9FIRM|nr:ABC transporter permease [Anaerosolibacter carboniphilus]MBB6216227.1 tungstate transport system permease protein [Anaerosolibacter carboniphilus]
MIYFREALVMAIKKLLSFDPELYGIVFLSLKISTIAVILSAVIGIPIGAVIALKDFKGKNIVVNVINTLMGIPPVVVGLIVYILLSNQFGILGNLRLLFSQTAMVIAQVMLAVPIIMGLTIVAIHGLNPLLRSTAISLGANRFQLIWTLIGEARYSIGSSIIVAFGRLLAEVGAVMMVGGNIRFQTRVMTTAIALHKGMGEFQEALALGIILLFLSLLITSGIDMIRRGKVWM